MHFREHPFALPPLHRWASIQAPLWHHHILYLWSGKRCKSEQLTRSAVFMSVILGCSVIMAWCDFSVIFTFIVSCPYMKLFFFLLSRCCCLFPHHSFLWVGVILWIPYSFPMFHNVPFPLVSVWIYFLVWHSQLIVWKLGFILNLYLTSIKACLTFLWEVT